MEMFFWMDYLFPIFFCLIFGVVVVMLVTVLVRGVREWSRNNASPVLREDVTVVSRRTHTGHSGGAGNTAGHTYTQYYVTFENGGGERLELQLSGREYGQVAEGDRGVLTHQGTRYQGFQRENC